MRPVSSLGKATTPTRAASFKPSLTSPAPNSRRVACFSKLTPTGMGYPTKKTAPPDDDVAVIEKTTFAPGPINISDPAVPADLRDGRGPLFDRDGFFDGTISDAVIAVEQACEGIAPLPSATVLPIRLGTPTAKEAPPSEGAPAGGGGGILEVASGPPLIAAYLAGAGVAFLVGGSLALWWAKERRTK